MTALAVDSDETLDAMLSMLTLTDREAYAHGYRVAALSVSIGRTLGFPDDELAHDRAWRPAARCREARVPEAILRKPAPLTVGGAALVRCHPADRQRADRAGAVSRAGPCRSCAMPTSGWTASAIRRGIHAAEVSLGARIVCVADAYDTMTRPRVFRDAISPREALLELTLQRHSVRSAGRRRVPAGDRRCVAVRGAEWAEGTEIDTETRRNGGRGPPPRERGASVQGR